MCHSFQILHCKQLQMSRSVGSLLTVGVPRVSMSICGKTDALRKCWTNYNLILKCPTGKSKNFCCFFSFNSCIHWKHSAMHTWIVTGHAGTIQKKVRPFFTIFRIACRTDCGGIYQLNVKLLGADKKTVTDKCHMERSEEHPSGKWQKVLLSPLGRHILLLSLIFTTSLVSTSKHVVEQMCLQK